jgi:hypothetical protein
MKGFLALLCNAIYISVVVSSTGTSAFEASASCSASACASAGCTSAIPCLGPNSRCYNLTKNDCVSRGPGYCWCGGCGGSLAEEDCKAWQSLVVRDVAGSQCTRSDPCACGGAKCDPHKSLGCVSCNRGHIENINLNGFGTTGILSSTIPSELQLLPHITQLALNNCSFTGTIPAALALISSLEEIDVSKNALTGTIPASLAILSKLCVLVVQHNRLTGKVPALPFSHYNGCGIYKVPVCRLDEPGKCTEPHCNHFSCPLPVGSDMCKNPGGAAGVHCK